MELFESEKNLKTERLVLEPLTPVHAQKVFEALQDKQLCQFIPDDPPPSLAALVEKYEKWSRRRSSDGTEVWLNWAILEPSAGHYIGTVQATVKPDKTALLAYSIFPSYQRQGFATEACQSVIGWLLNGYDVSCVESLIDSRNKASIQLVERLGFVRGETIKDADFFNGQSSHEYRYFFKPDWQQPADKYLIRQMNINDSIAVAELAGELGYPCSTEVMAARIQGLLDHEEHQLLVACDHKARNVLGWIHVRLVLSLEHDTCGEIAALVVSENHRGNRLGEKLMRVAEDWARTKADRMILRSQTKREDAHRFYLRLGYGIKKTSYMFEKKFNSENSVYRHEHSQPRLGEI